MVISILLVRVFSLVFLILKEIKNCSTLRYIIFFASMLTSVRSNLINFHFSFFFLKQVHYQFIR